MNVAFRTGLKLCLALGLCLGQPTQAWDKHQVLTRAALVREPALDREVDVERIEAFLTHNFGERCTWDKARDTVFDGVGRDFQLFYQSDVPYSFQPEWEKALNVLTLYPEAAFSPTDPQRVGGRAAARSVLATYSDEPDWKLDDDVERLASSNAFAEAKSGTATRALRHFYTPGEEYMGVNLGNGQETDQRMRLYYELALVAFDSGHEYWGYRFLADAVHYLQDMAQPFHVKLVINSDMLDMPVAIHRLACDIDRNLSKRFPDSGVARCAHDETLSRQIVDSAWYVGTYHALFEDFALAMLETNAFATREAVVNAASDFKTLQWRTAGAPWLDVCGVIRQAQAQILPLADETAMESFETFGRGYVRNRTACEEVVAQAGKNSSHGYRMGASYYLNETPPLTERQFRHRARLIEMTQSLQRVASEWTRQFIAQATAPRSEALRVEIQKVRQRLKGKCTGAEIRSR